MAIIIDTNFPGGAVKSVSVNNDIIVTFSAPVDGSLNNYSLWFYFRIRGAKGKKLHINQNEMEHILASLEVTGYGTVRPVVREGRNGEFYRIPLEDIVFCPNPISYSFTLTPKSDETYVAFCYPYQFADLLRFANIHSDLLNMQVIGKTGEGRDYPVLLAGDNGDSNKKLIIAIARQHSGESPSSFVLEGFMDQYLADNENAEKLREQSALLVLPMTHLDGVEEGRYGKDSPPQDFYNAWEVETIRPELHCFLNIIKEMSQKYKPGIFVDFHSPQPGAFSYIVPGQLSVLGQNGWKKVNQFIDLFEQLTLEQGSCRRQDLDKSYVNWNGKYNRLLASRVLADWYGMDTLSLETSYHLDCFMRYLSPDDWLFMGRQFCNGVNQIWFQNYNKDPVTLLSDELIWDGWEMLTHPVNTSVVAKPGYFEATAEAEGAAVFFGDMRSVKNGTEGSYAITSIGNICISCYVYPCREGKTSRMSRPYYLALNNGETVLPFSLFETGSYDSYYIAFQVNSFKGTLIVSRTP